MMANTKLEERYLGKIFVLKDRRQKETCEDYIGCQDAGIEAQKSVARLRREVSLETKTFASKVFGLGDFGPKNGVKSENDFAFKTHFYDANFLSDTPRAEEAVWVQAPGNHCYGFPTWPPMITTGIDNNYKQINFLVRHTYLDHQGKVDPGKVDLFSKDTIYVDELIERNMLWVMPARYYGIREGGRLTLMVDSVSYIQEYYKYFVKGDKTLPNQAEWLARIMKEEKTARIEICEHHPLRSDGKRFIHPETLLYLREEEIQKLAEHGITGKVNPKDEPSCEIMRRQMFEKQGFHFHAGFFADDHAGSCRTDAEEKDPLCDIQVLAGFGGGTLQPRYRYPKNVLFFTMRHGFVRRIDNQLHFYTVPDPKLQKKYGIKGHHICVDMDKKVILKKDPDETGVSKLKELVFQACEDYIQVNPPKSSGLKCAGWYYDGNGVSTSTFPYTINKLYDTVCDDVFFYDDLRNHFHRYEANTLKASVDYLLFAFETSPTLKQYFAKVLEIKLQITYEHFAELSLAAKTTLLTTGKIVEPLKPKLSMYQRFWSPSSPVAPAEEAKKAETSVDEPPVIVEEAKKLEEQEEFSRLRKSFGNKTVPNGTLFIHATVSLQQPPLPAPSSPVSVLS